MNKSIRKVKLISKNIFSNRSVLFYIQSIIIYNNVLVAVAYYSRFNLLYNLNKWNGEICSISSNFLEFTVYSFVFNLLC